MKHSWDFSRMAKAALVLATLSITGCAGPAGSAGLSPVAEAYNSASIIPMKPYTRTIFSSTDF